MTMEAWRKNEAADSFDKIKKGTHLTVKGYFKPEECIDAESGQKRNRIAMVAVDFYPTPEKEEEQKPAQEEKKAAKPKKKSSK